MMQWLQCVTCAHVITQEALFVYFTSLSACAGDRVPDRDVVAHYTGWLKEGRSTYSALLLFYFALFLQLQLPDDESKPRQLLQQAVKLLQSAPETPAWSAPIWCQVCSILTLLSCRH